jgi:DNA-binding transcriptional regulator GbsR (MarR family)
MNSESNDKLEKAFDPEIYIIEDEIITSLMNNPLFQARDQFFLKIFGLFITRQYLTQKTIKEATGFSIGKVSEEVNNLLDMGMIEVAHTSKYGKITYEASNAGILLLDYMKNILDKLVTWEKKLRKMRAELDEKRDELEDLYGYKEIYDKTDLYLNLITKYNKLLKKVELAIEELKDD